MRIPRIILALGAFFVLAAGISACGSSVPGNSVADMAGNPITLQAFNHWMYVAAKGSSQSASQPVIVPNDPPDFNNCIAAARKSIPTVAKQSNTQLRSECSQLFTSLSSQVMQFLIQSYWYQAQAAAAHIKVTNAQVQQQFDQEKAQQFPTNAAFQTFLTQTGETVQDILYRLKVNLILQRLVKLHTTPGDAGYDPGLLQQRTRRTTARPSLGIYGSSSRRRKPMRRRRRRRSHQVRAGRRGEEVLD